MGRLFNMWIPFTASDLNDEDAEIVVVPLEAQGDRSGNQRVDGSQFFSFAPYNPFRWNFGFFDDFSSEFFLHLILLKNLKISYCFMYNWTCTSDNGRVKVIGIGVYKKVKM